MLLLAPLLLLPLLQASPQWGFGGHRGFSPYSRHRSYSSGYGGYSSPLPEPEPEPSPRLTRFSSGPPASGRQVASQRLNRRITPSRRQSGRFQKLSTDNSRTFANFGLRKTGQTSSRFATRAPRIAVTRKPLARLLPTRAPETTQAPRRTTRRATRMATRPPTPPSTSLPTPPPTTTASPPAILRTQEPLLPAASDDFIDDVFEAFEGDSVSLRTNSGVVSSAWKVPPSLMAVAAVPGSPVLQGEGSEARQPREPGQQQQSISMDPYLEFMPVPAVPHPTKVTQESRRPKADLNSLPINLILPNSIKTRGPAAKPPAAQDDSQEKGRKKTNCQGRCVQQFCLPGDKYSVYDKCGDKCKIFCN